MQRTCFEGLVATVQNNSGAARASARWSQPDTTLPAADSRGGDRAGRHGGPPPAVVPATACSIEEIRQRLGVVVAGETMVTIADRTGFNPETVRRYLRTDCSIPADFVARVAVSYGVDPASIMLLYPAPEQESLGFDWDAASMADAAVCAVLPALRAWLQNAKQTAARNSVEPIGSHRGPPDTVSRDHGHAPTEMSEQRRA